MNFLKKKIIFLLWHTMCQNHKVIVRCLTQKGGIGRWLKRWILFWKQDMESCWPPTRKEVDQCTMGVQIKPSFDGKLDKLKARLMAKGYEQRLIIDFNKTFMLVIQSNMVRLIMVLVAHKKWELLHLDINMNKWSLFQATYLSSEEARWCGVWKNTNCCTQFNWGCKRGNLVESAPKTTWCTSNNYSIVCWQPKLYEDCKKFGLWCLHQANWGALPLHREKVLYGEIKLTYVTTNDQIANILTNSLGWIKFQFFRKQMGVQRLCTCEANWSVLEHIRIVAI